MSAKDFQIKFSLRMRFVLGFVVVILILFVFLLLFNNFSAPDFYKNSRERHLKESYHEIKKELAQYTDNSITLEQLEDNLDYIVEVKEIHAIVVNSDWSVLFVCDFKDRVLKERLVSSVLYREDPLNEQNNVELIEKNDEYVYQKTIGLNESDEAYEIWGVADGGYIILCRFTTASIKNSMVVMNKVIFVSGLIMLGAAVLAAFILSMFITTPLKKLTEIASDMSEMKFDARYTGKDTSEIGYLGNTMNDLSGKLEDSINKYKKANLELEHDIKNKENIQKQQKEFLSAISHDLKTPLALISGYAEALKDGVAKGPESINEYCEIIIDETGKMERMIKDMLSMNELESGRIELDLERFNIVKMVCSILNSNSIKFEKNNITVEFADQNDEIYVWGDKLQVERIIVNYLTNAINYCSGEKIIKVNIELKDETVRTHVWNSGENIPDEIIDEIWKKFYKADKARSRKYGGNGIGLSIVKTLCELHGQQCGVENTEGGVDFWFDLDS